MFFWVPFQVWAGQCNLSAATMSIFWLKERSGMILRPIWCSIWLPYSHCKLIPWFSCEFACLVWSIWLTKTSSLMLKCISEIKWWACSRNWLNKDQVLSGMLAFLAYLMAWSTSMTVSPQSKVVIVTWEMLRWILQFNQLHWFIIYVPADHITHTPVHLWQSLW